MTWDERFPPRELTGEITRFCVRRGHRDWRVIQLVCNGMSDAFLQTGRRYFIGCTTDELRQFYLRFFSAKLIGINFNHADLGPKPHAMLYVDYAYGVLGHGMGFFAWSSLWPKIAYRQLRSGALIPHEPAWKRRAYMAKCAVGMVVGPVVSSIIQMQRKMRRKRRSA